MSSEQLALTIIIVGMGGLYFALGAIAKRLSPKMMQEKLDPKTHPD